MKITVTAVLARTLLALTASMTIALVAPVSYGRLVIHEYEVVARVVADAHGWTIAGVSLAPNGISGGLRIRLAGAVGAVDANQPHGAYVVSHWTLGGVLATPITLTAILLAWPAGSTRMALVRLALGAAGLLVVEAFGSGLALLAPFADAEAILQGGPTPTLLEFWARVLQAGGGIALAAVTALSIIAVTRPSRPQTFRSGDRSSSYSTLPGSENSLRAEHQEAAEGEVGPQG